MQAGRRHARSSNALLQPAASGARGGTSRGGGGVFEWSRQRQHGDSGRCRQGGRERGIPSIYSTMNRVQRRHGAGAAAVDGAHRGKAVSGEQLAASGAWRFGADPRGDRRFLHCVSIIPPESERGVPQPPGEIVSTSASVSRACPRRISVGRAAWVDELECTPVIPNI